MGTDCYYIPIENPEDRDILYGEDPVKKFQSAFPVEIYPVNVLEYDGNSDFFSKFGLEIRNNVSILLSKRTFSQRVPQNTFTRPRDGDLIYVPFLYGSGELFEIKYVNHHKDFYTLGRKIPYFYELELEKFKYSNEVIETGVEDIDIVVEQSAFTIDLTVSTGTGTYDLTEIVYQSPDNTYANALTLATVQGWIPSANTLSVTNIKGEFDNSYLIIGATSNARYILSTYNYLDVDVKNEVYDNLFINTKANSIVNLSETNPFGEI